MRKIIIIMFAMTIALSPAYSKRRKRRGRHRPAPKYSICCDGRRIRVKGRSLRRHLAHGDHGGKCEGHHQLAKQDDDHYTEDHKVDICHEGHIISVDLSALDAHLEHGDTLGKCPDPVEPVYIDREVIVEKEVVVENCDKYKETPCVPGTVLWKFYTGAEVSNSPALGLDGSIYFGNDDGKLFSVNRFGEQRWVEQLAGAIDSSCAISSDGTIYAGTSAKRLYAVSPKGEMQWYFQTGHDLRGTPVIGPDDTIYLGSRDGNVYALDKNGLPKWQLRMNSGVWGSLAYCSTNNMLYAVDTSGMAYCIDTSGNIQWTYDTQQFTTANPCVDLQGRLIVGSRDLGNTLWCINSDGTLSWSRQFSMSVGSPIIGFDNKVYVGCSDNNFYCIDSDWGDTVWIYRGENTMGWAAMLGNDGMLYFGSNDDNIYCVKSDTGEPVWEVSTGDFVKSAPTLGNNGTLYIGSKDGYLYAICISSTDVAASDWPKFQCTIRNNGRK